ncbi:MAG: DoxX family protein [Fimbriiglobus sp.]
MDTFLHTPIPQPVIQAGLAGTVIALFVAVATNNWSPRVLALLALRLAIGWHFLFEGLHKVHSTYVGPTDTNRVFSSEIYFVAAEGPLGEQMRKQWIGDPDAEIAARIAPQQSKIPAFDQLPPAEQAALCPKAVADVFAKIADEKLSAAESAVTKAAEELAAATDDAKKAAAAEKKSAAERTVGLLKNNAEDLRARYARWVYGADRRDTKVKFVTTDVPLGVPDRLDLIELLRTQVRTAEDESAADLGHGYGTAQKRAAAARADLTAAKNELVKEADAFRDELTKLAGGSPDVVPPKKILTLDWLTRWGITAIGAGLLLGLFTRVWCVAGAGFLVLTYLSHPTVPWLPLPPMTEGNPLFVNKNLIEALALVVLATYPTGRWLGLDALLAWAWGCKRPTAAA